MRHCVLPGKTLLLYHKSKNMKKLLFSGLAIFSLAACSTSTETHSSTTTTSSTVTTADGDTVSSVTSSVSTVDATTFKSQMESEPGTILDVRTPEEVAEGHLANATVININDTDFEARINELDKTKPVYVYCKAGGRSARAADILKTNGFGKVVNLDGGITAWMENGFETVK